MPPARWVLPTLFWGSTQDAWYWQVSIWPKVRGRNCGKTSIRVWWCPTHQTWDSNWWRYSTLLYYIYPSSNILYPPRMSHPWLPSILYFSIDSDFSERYMEGRPTRYTGVGVNIQDSEESSCMQCPTMCCIWRYLDHHLSCYQDVCLRYSTVGMSYRHTFCSTSPLLSCPRCNWVQPSVIWILLWNGVRCAWCYHWWDW